MAKKYHSNNPNWKGGISSITHEDQFIQLEKIWLDNTKKRFLSKVKNTRTKGCWLWDGLTFWETGRARATFGKNSFAAARVAYVLFKGPIGDKWVLHTCDNVLCVNPKHLFLGTAQDNTDDMIAKGRKFLTKGTTNGQCKLSDAQVRSIRKQHAKGVLQYKLAEKYGVCKQTISLIVRNLTWDHV
jgi:hypothetical protein